MRFVPLLLVATLLGFAQPGSERTNDGPVRRFKPKIYEVTFSATAQSPWTELASDRQQLILRDAPIVFPIIEHGGSSDVDMDSLQGRLWLEGREDTTLNQRTRLDKGFPMGTQLAIMPIASFNGVSLRWEMKFTTQVWSTVADEDALGSIAWPQEWPPEVADALKPQMYIESDAEIFAQTVDRVSDGKLRLVPPYYAAKDLIRWCISEVGVVGDGVNMGLGGRLQGLEMIGALQTTGNSVGGPHDLVCVCVAILRAAGIPARAIIGIERKTDTNGPKRERNVFVSWAEFYLPQAGWIPFDPMDMRGKAIDRLNVRQKWPGFASLKDLNKRIPLAYHFIPPASVSVPRNPAVWGWDPRPQQPLYVDQTIVLGITSKGSGFDPNGPSGRGIMPNR